MGALGSRTRFTRQRPQVRNLSIRHTTFLSLGRCEAAFPRLRSDFGGEAMPPGRRGRWRWRRPTAGPADWRSAGRAARQRPHPAVALRRGRRASRRRSSPDRAGSRTGWPCPTQAPAEPRPARRRPWPGPAGLDAAAAGRRPDGDHWARRRRTDHSTQRRRLAVPAGTSSGFRSDGRPGRAGRRGRARVRGPVVHVGHQAGGRVDKGQVGAEPLPLPPRRKIAHGQPLPKVSDEHAAVHHRNRLGVAGQRDTGERPAGRQLNLLEGEGPPRRARPPAEQPNPVGLRGGQYVQRTAKRRCRPWPSGTKDAGSPGRVARTASHAAQPSHHSAAREGQLTPTTSTVCAPSHPPWPCTPQMASDPYVSRRP